MVPFGSTFGFLWFFPCWGATRPLAHSRQISVAWEQGDKVVGSPQTREKKLNFPNPALHRFPKGDPAGHLSSSAWQTWCYCKQSQPGALLWQCSHAFWGFRQAKLGLDSLCIIEVWKLEATVNLLLPRTSLTVKIQMGRTP